MQSRIAKLMERAGAWLESFSSRGSYYSVLIVVIGAVLRLADVKMVVSPEVKLVMFLILLVLAVGFSIGIVIHLVNPKLISGNTTCIYSHGYWKQQTDKKGNSHLDEETIESYLEFVSFLSNTFTDLSSIAQANEILQTSGSDFRFKAEAHLLTAWLNMASGALDWSEPIDIDGDGISDPALHKVLFAAEEILADTSANHDELVYVKKLAEAINNSDGHRKQCKD